MSSAEYKSPQHKLVKFFKNSRDKWEETAKERREKIRDLTARVRDLTTSRDLWRGTADTLKSELKAKDKELQELRRALAEARVDKDLVQKEYAEHKKKLKKQ